MTTHYADLSIVPDPESSLVHLLGALYDRLHLALVQQRRDNIGVSFPGYSTNPRSLGHVLRLHASAEVLSDFLQTDWLKGMRDHVRAPEIAAAPPDAIHRTMQRRQFKTSVERLRRRRMQRKRETAHQAADAIPSSVQRTPDLPYAHVRSRSSGQPFCLFLALGAPKTAAVPGTFNTYGLSATATIPWF